MVSYNLSQNYFFEVYISTVQKVSELKFRIEVRMNPQFWFFAHLSDHLLDLFCNAINDFTIG